MGEFESDPGDAGQSRNPEVHVQRTCPNCGAPLPASRNPLPTVDAVIFEPARGVLLIERANPPLGWALPGGFVDQGEFCEQAAVREIREETGLEVVLTGLLGVYSAPDRDPRQQTLSVVYTAQARDLAALAAGDDAASARFFPLDGLPELAFDHALILEDFARSLPRPRPGKTGR